MSDRGLAMLETYLHGLGELIRGGRVVPAWTRDGSAFGFVDGPPNAGEAWRVDLATGDKTPLLDVERARAAVAAATGETPAGRGVPFRAFEFAGAEAIRFQVGAAELTLDLASYEAAKAPAPLLSDDLQAPLSEQSRKSPREYRQSLPLIDPGPALEVLSPDGAFFLSTEDHNLVARSTYDGRTFRMTDDGTPEHEWRLNATSLVFSALSSTGGRSSACWAPDSRRFVAHKVDLRGVYRVPQVHYLKPEDEVVYRYAAKAGGVLERTTLHVLDLQGRPRVELDLGDTTDTYPVAAAWLPSSAALVLFQMSRDCKRADVLLADSRTGDVTPLFSEESDSFLRIHHDIYFYSQLGETKLGLWLTPDGEQIVWQSDRSGWRHLYLYDLEGNLVRQLTEGDWPIEDVVAIREGYVYLTGHRDQARPYDLHLYRVPLAGGEVAALTEARGVHAVALAPSGTAFLDTYSTVTEPPATELRTTDGRRLAELSRADIAPLRAVGWTPPEEFSVTAADGETELWGVIYKPHDFDPSKRYPLLEYIYGGPQSPIVSHSFVEATPLTFGAVEGQALAQLGYVTVMVDARATPGRSKAFHAASYLRWANVLADDHAETIRQLVDRHDFVDGSRVGIIGHSWGGYSAFRCLADRPDVYKAAVCSAPGFDPYAMILYECYLDLPQRNAEGYAFAETFPLAETVEGELMIVVGTSDHATWTDAVKMSEALIRAGKLHEFVALPEAYHHYDGVHDSYYWRRVAGFFANHLGQVSV